MAQPVYLQQQGMPAGQGPTVQAKPTGQGQGPGPGVQAMPIVAQVPQAAEGATQSTALVRQLARSQRLQAALAYLVMVIMCYFIAASYESPQLLQANKPPFNCSYAQSTRDGGGYCYGGYDKTYGGMCFTSPYYSPPPCDMANGVYKPPSYANPNSGVTYIVPHGHQYFIFGYYLFLFVVGIVATMKAISPRLRTALDQPIHFGRAHFNIALPTKKATSLAMDRGLGSYSISDLLLLATFLALCAAFFTQAYKDQVQSLWAKSSPPTQQKIAKGWGYLFGVLASILVGFVLLPMTKYSLVATMNGTGWEKAMYSHRILGTLFMVTTLAHAGCMMAQWVLPDADGGANDWTKFGWNLLAFQHLNPPDEDIWPWSTQAMVYFLLFGLSTVSVTALPPMRRRFYFVFIRVHLLVLPAFVLCVLAHSWIAWQFAIISLLLYGVDKCVQAVQLLVQLMPAHAVKTVRFETAGTNIVTFTLEQAVFAPEPGQVVYLCVPSLGWWPEFHPFTATADFCTGATQAKGASQAKGRWRHYINTANRKGRWTDRLLRMANGSDGKQGTEDAKVDLIQTGSGMLAAAGRTARAWLAKLAPSRSRLPTEVSGRLSRAITMIPEQHSEMSESITSGSVADTEYGKGSCGKACNRANSMGSGSPQPLELSAYRDVEASETMCGAAGAAPGVGGASNPVVVLPRVFILGPFGPRFSEASQQSQGASGVSSRATGCITPITPSPPATLLIAGGAGITPIAALLAKHLAQRRPPPGTQQALVTRPLSLVWIARQLELFEEFAPLLDEASAGGLCSVQLFYTSKVHAPLEGHPLAGTAYWPPTARRPDFPSIIAQTQATGPLHVHCCGPARLSECVMTACREANGKSCVSSTAVHYIAENFEL
jgi:predicted ferric reductase